MSKTINENMENQDMRIVRTRWMNKEANTILFTIHHQFKKRYHLDEPTSVLVIATDNGILIRKLDTETMK